MSIHPGGQSGWIDILAAYVGDTPIDIQASRAAGMASVAVLSGAGDSALLSAEGPDRIIHSHARLSEILISHSKAVDDGQ